MVALLQNWLLNIYFVTHGRLSHTAPVSSDEQPVKCAGLLGGAVYVNAFTLISRHVDPLMREFSLAAASLGDSLGIAFADVAGVLIQVSAYSLASCDEQSATHFGFWIGRRLVKGLHCQCIVCSSLRCIMLRLATEWNAAFERQSVHAQLLCVLKVVSLTYNLYVDSVDDMLTGSESEQCSAYVKQFANLQAGPLILYQLSFY